VLKALGFTGIEQLPPFALRIFPFEGVELAISRTGFTGDLGYELWIDPTRAEVLWDRLFDAGRIYGIKPMGTHALEIGRIEAGFVQVGIDYVPADQAVRPGRTRSPLELGLERLVDFRKPNFTGRRALLAEQQRGSRYRLVKLDVAGNKPAKDAFVYDKRRKLVGTVTSAVWSPAAKANIALASLERPSGNVGDVLWAEIYYQKELRWSRVMAKCCVVEGAFYTPARRRQTPAPDVREGS
jgi:aminomethyltransferase